MLARVGEHPLPLLIVALLVIVLFGANRLPEAARSIGRSTRILKSELTAKDDPSEPVEPVARRDDLA